MRMWASIWLVALLAACANPAPNRSIEQAASTKQWQGRIIVTVQSEPPRNMNAGFSLEGNVRQGELNLFSPLGTTLATLQWTPYTTQWVQGSQQRRYDSMAHLTEETTGAELPMDAVFDWLEGNATVSPGWQTDLSAIAQGTLVATRVSPEPRVVLRIKLDTP